MATLPCESNSDIKTSRQMRKYSLKVLDLSRNKLTTIPKEIELLQNLEGLYLQNNQLGHLPAELFLLINLKGLHLNGNKMPPQEIAELQLKLPALKIFY